MNDNIEWVLVPREPTEAMWNAGKHFCDGHVTRTIQAYAAMLASAPKPEAQAAWKVLQIGNYGAAYDSPNARRAFTYEHQPGNVLASRLGSAATAAVAASAGDSIDRGLSLLKSLQDEGFGVFQVDVAALSTPASHDAQQPEAAGALAREGNALRAIAEGNLGDGPGQANYLRIREFARAALSAAPAPAQQPAVVGDGVPLRVFSAGRWTYDGTGQTFSHEDMDAAAFVVYRDHAALTPAATPGDPEWEECPECSIGNGMRRGCDICDGSGSVPAAQKEGNGNG